MKKDLLLDFHKNTYMRLEKVKKDKKSFPVPWVKIFFKNYPRFNSTKLSKPRISTKLLDKCIIKRESFRDFIKKPLSKQQISDILYYSAGIINLKKVNNWSETRRGYPSAGGRFPIEIYTAIFNVKGINKGIYHYNVKNHSLELMLSGDYRNKLYNCIFQDMVKTCSTLIILSAVFDRTRVKYGDRAYRYIFLDAGHLTQNIYLKSASLNIGCCALGGFSDKKIDKLLDLKEDEENVIYISALGVKK